MIDRRHFNRWLTEQMPDPWRSSWERWLDSGSHYYQSLKKLIRHRMLRRTVGSAVRTE